jgi:hypothetical protein
MSLFLFKPHVEGPEGNITTPDIVIDRVFVNGAPKTINLISTETYHQVDEGEPAYPAYGITALGGGAVISPAVLLGSGRICLARTAWRLNNLNGNVGEVTLNGQSLAALRLPADLIEAAGGEGDTLPRGYLLICVAEETSAQAVLGDRARGRELSHRLTLSLISEDRWGDVRPKPRYSVGPMMKEVQHYI